MVLKDDIARVDGCIAVSRAIGDMKYKNFLIPVPETYNYQIQPEDDLLILSSDGIFNVYSEEQIAKKVHQMRRLRMSLKEIT